MTNLGVLCVFAGVMLIAIFKNIHPKNSNMFGYSSVGKNKFTKQVAKEFFDTVLGQKRTKSVRRT